MKVSQAAINWPYNPEQGPGSPMLPNQPLMPQQPVGLPFAQTHGITPGPPPFTNSAPQMQRQPGQYGGQFQQLAMQMAGAPGFDGVRSQSQMGVTPIGSGGGSGGSGYDGADPNRDLNGLSPVMNPNLLYNEGAGLGSGGTGGRGLATNQSWMNNYLDSLPGSGALGIDSGSFSGISGSGVTSAALMAVNPLLGIINMLKKDEPEEEAAQAEGDRTPQIGGNPVYGPFGNPGPSAYSNESTLDQYLNRISPNFTAAGTGAYAPVTNTQMALNNLLKSYSTESR